MERQTTCTHAEDPRRSIRLRGESAAAAERAATKATQRARDPGKKEGEETEAQGAKERTKKEAEAARKRGDGARVEGGS